MIIFTKDWQNFVKKWEKGQRLVGVQVKKF